MSDSTQSYSAKGEVSNITKRRTRFERIKIAFSKAPLSAWFGMIVLSIYLFAAFFAPFIAPHGEAEVFPMPFKRMRNLSSFTPLDLFLLFTSMLLLLFGGVLA